MTGKSGQPEWAGKRSLKGVGVLWTILVLFLTVLLCPQVSSADEGKTILYVTEGGAGSKDGSSWGNAMPPDMLHAATVRAYEHAPARVWVARGWYQGQALYNLSHSSSSPVEIYGGFAGNEPADYDLSLRNFTANETILGQNGGSRVLAADEGIIDGFTFSGGRNEDDYGGGMLVDSRQSLTIRNCVFRGNWASKGGGGVYCSGSTVTFSHCDFLPSNTTDNDGGAAYLYYGDYYFDHCRFIGNHASRDGGALMILEANAYFDDCLFQGNFSDRNGGAIENAHTTHTYFTNCSFIGNWASSPDQWSDGMHGWGGAVDNNEEAETFFYSCLFWKNSGFNGGAIMNYTACSSEAHDSLFVYNSAKFGGAVSNQSFPGGGGRHDFAQSFFYNCTLVANWASSEGGGISNYDRSVAYAFNTIIYGNFAESLGNEIITVADDGLALTSLHNCCYDNHDNDIITIQSKFQTTGCITKDPLLKGTGDYPFSLKKTSPCVDAGDDSYVDSPYDIRGEGFPRSLDGSTGQDGTVDIGAYEYNALLQPVFIDHCLSFDGYNDWVNLGDSWLLKPQSAMTVELWASVDDWNHLDDWDLISNQDKGGYAIETKGGSAIMFNPYIAGDYRAAAFNTSGLAPGWHHFAGTFDGQYVKLYVDGELKSTYDVGPSHSISYESTISTLLGAEADVGFICTSPTNCRFEARPDGCHFKGKIDEVRVWYYARSEAQIKSTMNHRLVGGVEDGLSAYYQCNQSSGSWLFESVRGGAGSLMDMSDASWQVSGIDWQDDRPPVTFLPPPSQMPLHR